MCRLSRSYRTVAMSLTALVFALATVTPALAYGNSTVQVSDNIGPYHVAVVTGPPREGTGLLLTVVLMTVVTDSGPEATPVSGAKIVASFQRKGGEFAPLLVPIPTEPTLPDSGYYERNVTVPSDGDWHVTVDVNGPLGPASANFDVTVLSSGPDWRLLGAGLLLVGAVSFFGYSLLAGKGKRTQRPAPTTDAPAS